MTRDELARRVAERALLHGDFVLRSGKRSSVYLDKYRFETDPALLGPIGAALAELARERSGARPAGRPGARSRAAGCRRRARERHPLPDRAQGGQGLRAPRACIEGVFEPGERVLVVEDVVTTGGALIAAIEALRAAGLLVERALCVLDREEGGGEALAALGVRLEPLFRRADLGMPVA